MIIVVEGPSGAGKTTWSAAHGAGCVVPETAPIEPPDATSAAALAEFWSEANCRRWAEADRLETAHGLAVCDTDPLKLHYDYCLALIGEAPWKRFDAGVAAASDAIGSRRLGMADIVLLSLPDDEALARRRSSDTTRRRRNFDLHRRLSPGLRCWYLTLDQLDPGRVAWELPQELPGVVERDRYDRVLFERWMEQLPRHATNA